MKSQYIRRLIRALIALVGAGIGAALTLGVVELYTLANPGASIPLAGLVFAYICLALLGGLVFFLISPKLIALCTEWGMTLVKRLDHLSFAQLMASTIGLIGGLLIAALVSQILNFMGDSIFTTAFSALLYVLLGLLGLTLGARRSGDMAQLLGHTSGHGEHRFVRRHRHDPEESPLRPARPKLMDASALIDGRILELCKAGFLEGEVIVPSFVLGEIKHIAASSDALRRARGRRGLDILSKLSPVADAALRMDDTDYPDLTDTATKLLRLADELAGMIVTSDSGLTKAAAAAGIAVMNLNELAGALRPAVLPGETMAVQLVKEGKEPGQGVGYLDDGTMIVVEGGRSLLGTTAEVTVTTALQTSAGRMIFARLASDQPS